MNRELNGRGGAAMSITKGQVVYAGRPEGVGFPRSV
jgi:hypothetical protein